MAVPFTVSHVAAVLPVAGRSERFLPAAGLVAGSMAPDYPWFLTGGRSAGLSHSALGIVTVDLVAGVLGVLLWRRLVAAPVRDLLPRRIGRAVPEPARTRVVDLPWLTLAVVTGAVTHVLWDGFTHPGRFGVRWIGWLSAEHAGVPGHQWAQLVSGAVGGLAVLAWAVARVVRENAPPGRPVIGRSTLRERLGALLVVLVGLLVGALVGLVTAPPDLESMLFRVVTRGGLAAGLGAVAVCLAWHARAAGRVGASAPGR